jgi:hypothetical protein
MVGPWRAAIRAALRDDSGQQMVEMALVTPVFLLALLVVVNAMLFMSECARFDRVAAEATRSAVNTPTGKIDGVLTRQLNTGMGYDVKNPLGFRVSARHRDLYGQVFADHMEITCRLEWTPWPSPRTVSFPALGGGAQVTLPTNLVREKSLVIDHFLPAAIF